MVVYKGKLKFLGSRFLRRAKTAVRAAVIFLLVLLFQNCGRPFETSQDFSSIQGSQGLPGDSTSSTTPPSSTGSSQTGSSPAVTPTPVPTPTNPSTVGTACSVANGTGKLNSFGQCEAVSCSTFYKLENKVCVVETENRVCVVGSKKGTQGFVSGAWSTCTTCDDGYTSFKGTCYEDPALIRRFASILPTCWKDRVISCPVAPFAMFIGAPTKYSINSSETTVFAVTYTGAASVQLAEDQVIVSGLGSAGCKKAVAGVGLFARTISISNCSGIGPIKISISAGSATGQAGQQAPALTAAAEVVVTNVNSIAQPYLTEATQSYPGATGKMIPFEYSYPKDFATRKNIPMIIWIHGGGWTSGSATEDRMWAQALAELGFIVLNLNYTLAPPSGVALPGVVLPAVPYSIGANDIQAFLEYMRSNAHIVNGDLSRVSIAGMSAGGHLALNQATRKDNTFQFRCVINVAGPSDLVSALDGVNYPVSKAIVRNVMGDGLDFLQNVSPIFNMNNFKGDKLALFHQLLDNLVPVAQTGSYVSKIKEVRPQLDLTVSYGQDINPYPWINPRADQLSHSFDSAPILTAVKSYVQSSCR